MGRRGGLRVSRGGGASRVADRGCPRRREADGRRIRGGRGDAVLDIQDAPRLGGRDGIREPAVLQVDAIAAVTGAGLEVGGVVVVEEENCVELDIGTELAEGSSGVVVEATTLEAKVHEVISDNDKAPGTDTAPKLEVFRGFVLAPVHVEGRRGSRRPRAYREVQTEGGPDAVRVEAAAVSRSAERNTQILKFIVPIAWAGGVGETTSASFASNPTNGSRFNVGVCHVNCTALRTRTSQPTAAEDRRDDRKSRGQRVRDRTSLLPRRCR